MGSQNVVASTACVYGYADSRVLTAGERPQLLSSDWIVEPENSKGSVDSS
ncbi:hypothetical protein L917_02911 [Phytophthora nicotianae]|nr:hypothetical protein L917_02911 [Phytophthora nicotianae]